MNIKYPIILLLGVLALALTSESPSNYYNNKRLKYVEKYNTGQTKGKFVSFMKVVNDSLYWTTCEDYRNDCIDYSPYLLEKVGDSIYIKYRQTSGKGLEEKKISQVLFALDSSKTITTTDYGRIMSDRAPSSNILMTRFERLGMVSIKGYKQHCYVFRIWTAYGRDKSCRSLVYIGKQNLMPLKEESLCLNKKGVDKAWSSTNVVEVESLE